MGTAAGSYRGLLLLVAAGVLWGTGGIAGSFLLAAGVHPLGTAAYRAFGGGLLASLALLAMGGFRTVPRTGAAARRLVAAGLLLAVFQASYFGAIQLTSVSLATLVTIGSVPVFVTLGASALDRRWPRPRLAAAVVIAVSGLALLAGSPGLDVPAARIAAGVGCALAAGAGFSALTLINRRQVPGLDPLAVTALGLLAGGLALAPLALWAGMAFAPTPVSVGALLYLAAVPTALGYLAYFAGLRSAPATAAGLVVVLEPLTATLLAIVLLGEALSALGAAGAALLLTALLLAYWRPDRG